jgi:GH15 family glucan-1,4-alpha-glucosidase
MQAWRAFDCAVRAIDEFGYDGPRDRWAAIRERIRDDVLAHGYDERLGAFTQAYGSGSLDAAVLAGAIVGFLPADDPRFVATVAALERTLMRDGFLFRTSQDPETDATHADAEGAFLACNFWLADVYALQGRTADARALIDRVAGIAGRTGLLSEEYDPSARRLVGNLPQTLSHASLVNSAITLRARSSPVRQPATTTTSASAP